MIAAFRQRLLSFAKTAPFELWPTLVILSGIATFNREFVHIGFRRFYVTEVLLTGTLLVALMSALFSSRHRRILRELCGRQFRLFHLLLVYAVVWLLVRHEQGLLAVRHSMMVFSVAFVALFAFAFSSTGALVGTLRYLLILTSTFNAAKIVRNWTIGLRIEGEPLRVAHNEVDVICASLSLIGLWVLGRQAGRRHWLWLTPLMAANFFILLMTVKRTAALGLLVVLLLAAVLGGGRRTARAMPRIIIGVAASLLVVVVLASLNVASLGPVAAFIANKFRFLTEANATWRLVAWRLAWQRFLEAPFVGIGYGLPILQSSLRDTRTEDPHNSFLAFIVRHGLVGGTLFLAFLAQVSVRYVKRLKSSTQTPERALTLFFLLAFVYMIMFAAFNVVLENQYEGIFFWFALSGAFIVRAARASGVGLSVSEVGAGQEADEQERTRIALHAEIGGRRCGFVVASPLSWIRGTALAGAGVYALLIVSPWNYLPKIDIYTAARRAQVPLCEAGRGATVQVSNVTDGLSVAVDPRWSQPSAIEWALPESLTDDFRLQMAPREWWNRWLAVKWILPEDFTRTVRRGTDYAIVLELGSPEQAHKPYVFILDDVWGQRYQATGRAVGNARVVPLREFETGAPVHWKDARHLHLQFPPSPRPVSLQVKSLGVARQVDALAAYGGSADMPPTQERTTKCVVTRSTITDFETYDGRTDAKQFEFGAGSTTGAARGGLWSRGDGTGTPVLKFVSGADSTKQAVQSSNARASGWGAALGVWLACLDATAFHGVEFWVRGTAPTGVGRLALEMKATTPPSPGHPDKGTCVGADPDYDCYAPRADFPITDRWNRVRLAWSAFRPGFNGSTLVAANGESITGLSFAVQLQQNPETDQAQPGAVELAIDELSFF